MPDQNRRDIDEWRLGLEPGEPHPPHPPLPPVTAPIARDLSADRLEAPLYVLTVEHLGWAAVALYALLTRLGGLGMRPLSAIEAFDALFARDLANRGLSVVAQNPPASGWLDPLRAGVFLAFGTGDFGARIVAAIFSLMLIGAAFAMRRRLGRAGALAFATMLTISPTLTWFSRSTSAIVPAMALIVIAVALVFALVGTADTAMVVGLAVAIALALSAAPIAFPIAAMFLVILILMGLYELIFRRNPIIRFRVWWERRSAHLIFCAAIAIGLFVVFESGLGRRNLVLPIAYGAMQQWLPILHPTVRGGVDFYLPALAFYEFAIAIAGVLGLVTFLTFQLRSRIATVAFLWTIFALAFFITDPVRSQDWLVMMLVPAALIGAAAIDKLHRTKAWRIVRYPIAVLVLLTIYVQLASNFVHFAPDPSEASWAHHMLLYWTDPATTILSEQEFTHAERAVSDRGTVFLTAPNLVEQWYLRDMKFAESAASADMVVSPATAEKPPNLLESSEFTLDQKWSPSLAGLTAGSALRYFFTQRAWSEVSGTEIRIEVRGPTPINAAPPITASPVPSESPSPIESPAAIIATSPSATITPTASPSPTEIPAAAMTPNSTPAPRPTATMESTPAPTPVSSASSSPEASPTSSADSQDSQESDDSDQSDAPETPSTAP
jgi:uncharacterized protein (TIGR03663 family)